MSQGEYPVGWDPLFVQNYPLMYDSGEVGSTHWAAKQAMGKPRFYTHYRGPPNPKTLYPPVVAPSPMSEAWRDQKNLRRKGRIDMGSDINAYEHYFPETPDYQQQLPDPVSVTSTEDAPAAMSTNYENRDGLVEAYRAKLNRNIALTQGGTNDVAPMPEVGNEDLIETYVPTPKFAENSANNMMPYGGVAQPPPDVYEPNLQFDFQNTTMRDTSLPNTMQVNGKDNRFQTGDYFHYRSSQSQPQASYEYEITNPINHNLAISVTPDYDAAAEDALGPSSLSSYSYTRWDPQLVRDARDLSPNRALEMPQRDRWSQKMSQYEAPPGSIPLEDIYNPTFSGYGDSTRYYEDLTAGQIRYYYRNVDAYRNPNFVTRNKVDHLDYFNPTGEVWPIYERDPGQVEDYRKIAEDDFLANSLYHREDLMSRLKNKMDRRDYQLRLAPLRNQQMGGYSVAGSSGNNR